MKILPISQDILLHSEIEHSKPGAVTLRISKEGGGLDVTEIAGRAERYLVFDAECMEDHSLILNMNVYEKAGDAATAFFMRFGILPGLRARICLDLQRMDARALFSESYPGQLKVVCHGRRVERVAMEKITLEMPPCFHDVALRLSELTLTDTFPEAFPLPDRKLIDELGQWKPKQWPGKLRGIADMREKLRAALGLLDAYSDPDWDSYGGYAKKPVQKGTGYFTSAKACGRWTLVDPLGNAFFSVGPDCVVVRPDCRVDALERFMDWLPGEDDPVYATMFKHLPWPFADESRRRDCTLFSFPQANLYRAFGDDWHGKWQRLMSRQMKHNGLNTLGNWSDPESLGVMQLPYVTMLEKFPDTKLKIFRDFPDVLSDEYRESAKECAQALKARANDPLMIGYFLRNEPQWAFVDGLILADEVFYNPEPSVCKRELIAWLQKKYRTAEVLAEAWRYPLKDFDALNKPIKKTSALSETAKRDMKAFSCILLDAYAGVISKACREVDKHHMNLGMRWAWISDPDLVTGWQYFDVFSINCYAADPTEMLDSVVDLGVDLPVMIGEYHFGALDAGQTATGLEAVKNQLERGKAYRYYTERAAAHLSGVGCHWFQCYDQFALGRFDGENYNIGLFDLCSLPNETMMRAVRESGRRIYAVKFGDVAPMEEKPATIPMIAY
ncbi:MAG: beta-galactosidase [Clostridiales bacterium]|nr:beta-galactosidase [Clostridiales bacterium]